MADFEFGEDQLPYGFNSAVKLKSGAINGHLKC